MEQKDNFPEAYRFTASVFPSDDDHVITSPYNSVLALNHLAEYADCVFPIDNQSLIEICNRMVANGKQKDDPKDKKKAFGTMNNIAAHLMLNLTR
jgi:tubulin epsilon